MGNKVLLLCETKHVLLNYLILKKTELKDANVDIILTDTTEWGSIGDELENSNLFNEIFYLPLKKLNLQSSTWSKEERKFYQNHLNRLFKGYPRKRYDEVWFNLPSYSSQLLWAFLAKHGKNEPHIYYIDEGTASYTLKPFENPLLLETWPFQHRYISSIKGLWLLNSGLWSGSGRISLQINQLDIDLLISDADFIEFLKRIFTPATLPHTKYIFFEECYIRNRHTVNDLELLKYIADFVGKDNITIRLHPKTSVDRFTLHGFQVAMQDNSLWELMCLLEDLSDKVFLTVKSSATFSALSISRSTPCIVVLKDLVKGCFPNKNASDFVTYLDTVKRTVNQDEARLFVPQSLQELQIILNDLKRR